MKWVIRGGDTDLKNAEKRKEATTGELCDGVSVYLLNTKTSVSKKDAFGQEVRDCIGKLGWTEVCIYKEQHFKALERKIPKTWKGPKGIVKKEPPKNHYELYGYPVADVVALFKSKKTKVKVPKGKAGAS